MSDNPKIRREDLDYIKEIRSTLMLINKWSELRKHQAFGRLHDILSLFMVEDQAIIRNHNDFNNLCGAMEAKLEEEGVVLSAEIDVQLSNYLNKRRDLAIKEGELVHFTTAHLPLGDYIVEVFTCGYPGETVGAPSQKIESVYFTIAEYGENFKRRIVDTA